MSSNQPNRELDLVFRHEYGRIVARLTSKYSAKHIELIEDSVQEALYRAMRVWAHISIPENPSGWLYRVAQNHLIDQLRRNKRIIDFQADAETAEPEWTDLPGELFADGIVDEQLQMVFACCHPALKVSDQLMLSLKLLCGLSVREISHALIRQPEATKKAITRAKQKFKDAVGALVVPQGEELKLRLNSVMKVIYLLFNEGYKTSDDKHLIKKDVCEEAIRLGGLLHKNAYCGTPELSALLAMMYFKASRFDARINERGELVTLDQQDRNLWNREYIRWGFCFLSESTRGKEISTYHLEAGIAAQYISAPEFEQTNWQEILRLYDLLMKVNPSPLVALNRIVVLEKIEGVEVAVQAIEAMEVEIQKHYLYHSIYADLEKSRKNVSKAVMYWKKARDLATNPIEIRFLENKISTAHIFE